MATPEQPSLNTDAAKFIYWLKTNVGKEKITELSLGEKLEEFRTVAKSYIEPSFTPIVGYNDHGAIVHYSANKESDYEIKDEGMVLIDSGGHYLEGTTDITNELFSYWKFPLILNSFLIQCRCKTVYNFIMGLYFFDNIIISTILINPYFFVFCIF